MLLIHILGNGALQAVALVWLFLDCRANTALRNMTIFVIPLGLSALHLIGGFICWERLRHGKPSPPPALIVIAGVGTTLIVLAACYIEGNI